MIEATQPRPLPEDITSRIAALSKTRDEFDEMKRLFDRLSGNADQLRKSAEAAEGEAQQARSKLRGLLRESNGKPGKPIFAAKGEERAALSMAEEMRAVAKEHELERDRLIPELSALVTRYETNRNSALLALSEHLTEEALAAIPQSLIDAIHIRARLEAKGRWSTFNTIGIDDDAIQFAARSFVHGLIAAVKEAGNKSDFSPYPPELAPGGLNVSGFNILTPASMNKFKEDLARRESELSLM